MFFLMTFYFYVFISVSLLYVLVFFRSLILCVCLQKQTLMYVSVFVAVIANKDNHF